MLGDSPELHEDLDLLAAAVQVGLQVAAVG